MKNKNEAILEKLMVEIIHENEYKEIDEKTQKVLLKIIAIDVISDGPFHKVRDNVWYIGRKEYDILVNGHVFKYLKQLRSLRLHFVITERDELEALDLQDYYFGYIKFQTAVPKINRLPDEIGEMTELVTLDIEHTDIRELPDSIANLKKLEYLFLANTKIEKVPSWINRLGRLKAITLSSLKLHSLPKEILELGLPFKDNRISLFSHSWGKGIYIKNLSLYTQPISLFHQSRDLIENYYHSKKIEIRESKLIFLGSEGVGKTHTIARIINDNHRICESLPETPGISISFKDFYSESKGYRIKFWDFGGQEIMHAMHRCFLTDRTGYVVVVSTRFGDVNKQARYWLKNIDSFTNATPVVVFVNKWSDGTFCQIDENSLKRDYPNIIAIKTCSAKDGEDVDFTEVTESILKMALKNDSIGMLFPESWENIRQDIINLGKSGSKKYYISQQEFHDKCRKNGIEDEDIQKWLLDWFNDLGECFSYQFEKGNLIASQDLKVLNPEWLTNAIYIIIREARVFAYNGSITHEGISELLANSDKGTLKDVRYSKEECEYILEVMRKFKLSYKIPGQNKEFIPALLNENTPSNLEYVGKAISYEMRYKNLPENVIHNLMIMMFPYLDPQRCWRKGAVIDVRNFLNIGMLAILDMSREDEILRIKVYSFANHAPWELLQEILSRLNEINGRMNLKTEDYVILGSNNYPSNGVPEAVSVDKLLRLKERGVSIYPGDDKDYVINELLGDMFGEKQVQKIEAINSVENYINGKSGLNIRAESISGEYKLVVIKEVLKQSPEELLLNTVHNPSVTVDQICSDLISACKQIQSNYLICNTYENQRSTQVRDILSNRGRYVRDQTLYGHAKDSRNPGEVDLMVMKDSSDPLTIIEAMNLDSVKKGYIYDHLKKLVDDYNPSGLRELFLVAYVKKQKDRFQSFWDGYYNYLEGTSVGNFHFKNIKEEDTGTNNVKHAVAEYVCDKAVYIVHHISMWAGN